MLDLVYIYIAAQTYIPGLNTSKVINMEDIDWQNSLLTLLQVEFLKKKNAIN